MSFFLSGYRKKARNNVFHIIHFGFPLQYEKTYLKIKFYMTKKRKKASKKTKTKTKTKTCK